MMLKKVKAFFFSLHDHSPCTSLDQNLVRTSSGLNQIGLFCKNYEDGRHRTAHWKMWGLVVRFMVSMEATREGKPMHYVERAFDGEGSCCWWLSWELFLERKEGVMALLWECVINEFWESQMWNCSSSGLKSGRSKKNCDNEIAGVKLGGIIVLWDSNSLKLFGFLFWGVSTV